MPTAHHVQVTGPPSDPHPKERKQGKGKADCLQIMRYRLPSEKHVVHNSILNLVNYFFLGALS